MSGNFHHKIFNFEIIPPQETWRKIADQLDEEYNAPDIHLSEKLQEYEISPPAFLFDNILAEINPAAKHKPAVIFRIPVKRVLIAAVTIGVIAISFFYFVKSNSYTKPSNATKEVATPSSDPNVPSSNPDKSTNVKTNADLENTNYASLEKTANKKPQVPSIRYARNRKTSQYASLTSIRQANFIRPISVYAPPICDRDGNIILDENLISAPDGNYVIVTSPSGEQTKVSRKFFKMLTLINGGSRNAYIHPESSQWKTRFEEWRSKLLQQTSYIPTANNFLDIMDLKEMLQEN